MLEEVRRMIEADLVDAEKRLKRANNCIAHTEGTIEKASLVLVEQKRIRRKITEEIARLRKQARQ